MAESITIARPYAKAAFEAAKEKDALAAWSGMLAYAGAVAEDEEMKVVLDHPSLTSEQKTQLFTEVCGDKLDADAQRYIAILAENKRLALLSDMTKTAAAPSFLPAAVAVAVAVAAAMASPAESSSVPDPGLV